MRQPLGRQRKSIEAFAGLRTSLDPAGIPDNNCQDILNYDLETGALIPRYGYAVLKTAQSGHTANYGCVYLQGYNSSYALTEEYVTFENLGAGVNAYSRNVNGTSAPTAITNATGLAATDWRGVSWDSYSYLINDSYVRKYTLGDTAAGWTTPNVLDAPTLAPTYELQYQSTAGATYAQMNWDGTNPSTEITYTGIAYAGGQTTENADDTLTICHTTGTSFVSSFQVDLSSITNGAADWQYNDAFAFSLTAQSPSFFALDPATIAVTLTSTSGTVFAVTRGYAVEYAPGQYHVFVRYDNKTRASWSSIKYFKVSYTVKRRSGTNATLNNLIVSKVSQGCCYPCPSSVDAKISLGYAYYNTTTTDESGLSPLINFAFPGTIALQGTNPFLGIPDGLGVWINVKSLVATGSADKSRIYFGDGTDAFYRVVEQNDTTANYLIKASYDELVSGTRYYPAPYSFTNAVAAIPFKGWMVWLYKGGYQNVKHSRVGDPESLADLNNQLPDGDGNRAATFSLADNFSDQGLGGVQADDVLLILGGQGVYAQIGDTPSVMTPPKKLPGAFGGVGYYSFARWKDDQGVTGMAYLATNQQVYFVSTQRGVEGFNDPNIVELTEAVRPTVKSFLMDGQSLTSLSTARVAVDEFRDALWVVMGSRAMVLRRKSPVSQAREWELYNFNLTGSVTIKYLAFSQRNRMRAMLSDGKFIEFEWNSQTGAWITGSNRDGGNAMPSPYFRTKTFAGPNRRFDHPGIRRDTSTDTPSVLATTSRSSQTVTLVSGQVNGRFAPYVQGRTVDFKITGGENYAPLRTFYWTERAAAERFAE